MKENVIKAKSFNFALSIVDTYKKLAAEKKEFVLSKQLLRSGTSVGAMICEAEDAESKLDFIHKLAIAQKEANESQYWIALLFQSGCLDQAVFASLTKEIVDIRKILGAIIITTKQRIGKV